MSEAYELGLGDDDGQEVLFSEEVADMKETLLNEKSAPEILPYEDELVSGLLASLQSQVRSMAHPSLPAAYMTAARNH